MNARQRVRALFLAAKRHYSPAEATALLGWSAREMADAIATGEIESTGTANDLLIAWQEVAAIATSHYSHTFVEEALGDDATSILPELVRLAELRVRIPRYQTAMLDHLAEREQLSVDEFVARHFLDLASAEYEPLKKQIAGFGGALLWPRV